MAAFQWFTDLLVKGGRLQGDQINLNGQSAAETEAFSFKAIFGLGVQLAQSWIFTTSGTIYNQGNGQIKSDGTLSLQGSTINATGQIVANNGIKFSDGTALTSSPFAIFVQTKTIAAIQAAYDAVPSGAVATIWLSGIYLRTGTESLSITSGTKTVWFKSLDYARIHDPNNTATQSPLIFINNQTGGGFDGVHFSTASNYTSFNYGIVFINEAAPINGYTFRNGSVTGPTFLGNGITIQAWSQSNNGGAGGGCIHRGLLVERFTFFKLGRMGLEATCHNEQESGVPTRIFDTTVRDCVFSDLGLVVKDGMGSSFSGSLENVIHIGNRYDGCKQYCVEFIGTRSGVSNSNVLLTAKTWGDGANGTGTNLSNGYNFTDGGNAGLGAKNLSIGPDEITVNGRPMLVYACSKLTFTGGTWKGGLVIDINKGGGSGAKTSDLKMSSIDITIDGPGAQGVIQINNSERVTFWDLNMSLAPTSGDPYSIINVYSNNDRVLLSGGSWRRPASGKDNLYNFYSPTNSPAVGAHLESTF